jgi:hypothetical protein
MIEKRKDAMEMNREVFLSCYPEHIKFAWSSCYMIRTRSECIPTPRVYLQLPTAMVPAMNVIVFTLVLE